MKIGAQIRRRREALGVSQEALAGKVFVSRQTISNWENDRTYPDIRSIALMGEVFDVTLDELIREDITTMENAIDSAERDQFNSLALALTLGFIATVVTPVPLIHYFSTVGLVVWIVIAAVTMVIALKVETVKKRNDVQTYRELLAFTRGEQLTTIDRAREEGKRPYQKVAMVVAAAALAAGISLALGALLG